jgi:hypothetical protein
MQCRFPLGNVSLDMLIERIESFLLKADFSTSKTLHADCVEFSAFKGNLNVKVAAKKFPGYFLVEFTASGVGTMRKLGSILGLFGGGAFVLRDIKSEDELRRLEEDFWREMYLLFYP